MPRKGLSEQALLWTTVYKSLNLLDKVDTITATQHRRIREHLRAILSILDGDD